MNRVLIRRALLLLFFFFTAISNAAEPGSNNLKSGVFNPPRLAPDFSLLGSDGAPLKLSRYRGKVIMLAFGYTTCADVCPVTLAVLAQTRKQLGALGKEVQVVYVTVDPERDSAEHMRNFLAAFDPTFMGATGTAAQLSAVRQAYGITATKKPFDGGGYAIAHSSYIYLIDRQGNLCALMPYGHSADDFAHDLRILLKK